MKRIKAIATLIFVIFMEMAIFSMVTVLLGDVAKSEVLTKSKLFGNVLFVLIYNPIFLLITYLRRNSNEKSKDNYKKVKTLFNNIFK